MIRALPTGRVYVERVRLNAGGYDARGTYWGAGAPLYCATDREDYCEHVRASSREAAAQKLGIAHLVRSHGSAAPRFAVFEGDACTLELTEMLRTHRGARRYRTGRDTLIQTDWDYPGVASAMRWRPASAATRAQNARCDHSGTDGTVDCACGLTASRMIEHAGAWIRARVGRTYPDPGYFGVE